jgi:hypothetical protein
VKIKLSPWLLLVLAALIWRAVYAYWTPTHFNYLVPPGDDAANHLYYITTMLQNKISLVTSGYPMGFHLIIIALTKILHMTALKAVIWFTPLLLILPIISIYLAGKKIFESEMVGAVAAAIWAFIALGPVRAFGDGNYPNLLASSVILPLAVAYVYLLVSKPSWKNLIYAVVFSMLIVLTHHLTVVYLLIAVGPWALIYGVNQLWKKRHHEKIGMILWVIVGILLFVGLGWLIIGPIATPFIENIIQGRSLAEYFGSGSNSVSWQMLLELNNPVLVYTGLIGLVAMLFSRTRFPQKMLMIFWVLILIWFSTTSFFGLPGRFVRELAIPLSLCGGFLGWQLWQWANAHRRGWMVVAIIVLGIGVDFVGSFHRPYALPDPFHSLIRVSNDQSGAFQFMNTITPESGVIMANNGNPFIKYLVNRNVLTIISPTQLNGDVNHSDVFTIYIASRPPLTSEDVYPYYANYDQISAKMRTFSSFRLSAKYPDGTEIYTRSGVSN